MLVFFPTENSAERCGTVNDLAADVQPGEVLPRRVFFALRGTDQWGNQWRARWLLPHVEGRHRVVIRADVRELCYHDDVSYGFSLELECFEKLPIPVNVGTTTTTVGAAGGESRTTVRNSAIVEALSVKMVFVQAEETLICRVSTATRLPFRFRHRLTEALQFVLARKVQWPLELRRLKTGRVMTLRPNFQTPESSRLRPPIHFNVHDHTRCVWPLFAKYLEYISGFRKRRWHPISEHVYGVIEASEGSFFACALSLAIAIEGIAVSHHSALMRRPEGLQRAITSLEAHLLKWPELESLGAANDLHPDRLRNLLRTVLNPSVSTVFKGLVQAQLLDEASVKAWKRVRHPRAHGKIAHLESIDELVRDIDTLTSLFYRVTFSVIGYTGKFTDYGSPGWPVKSFPPAKAAGVN